MLAPLRFECPYRILFGPLGHASVLGRWLGHPNIRSFNASRSLRSSAGNVSLALEADHYFELGRDSFADLLAQLPPGWEPDLVIWYNLATQGLPPGIEDCPWPSLAIVHDWPLNFQPVLDYAEAFDLVVAERGLLEVLERSGFRRGAWWSCYAHDPARHALLPGLARDWDISFLGNMGYHYQRGRNRWLERLARLGERHRVLISDRYYGEDYTRLLNQSKIAFNFGLRGEMNMRSYEAAACGALLFQEAGNREIGDFLIDGESCVLYGENDFEAKVDYYLSHEDERRRIAANGARAIAAYDCERQFARLLELVPRAWAEFAAGGRQAFRQRPLAWRWLLAARQLAQALTPGSPERGLSLLSGAAPEADPGLQAHLEAVRATLILNRHWQPLRLLQPGPFAPEAAQALQSLAQAVGKLADHPWQIWHRYNLACAASLLRRPDLALPLWQQLVPRLAGEALDFAALAWLLVLPRGEGRERHDFAFVWDMQAADVAAGRAAPESLRQLLLWQAFELSGYCLMWVRQPEAAIQAFLQAEALGPGTYFTYAPLLQLLLQTGREAELLACLKRAVAKLGLIESLQRDLITTLLRQGQMAELKPVLAFYRQLLLCFEGGGSEARDSLQTLIPGLLSWIPELLEARLDGQG